MTECMRERVEQILKFRRQGKTDVEIGAIMGLKSNTVKKYVSDYGDANAFRNDGPKNRVEIEWDKLHMGYVEYRNKNPKEAVKV